MSGHIITPCNQLTRSSSMQPGIALQIISIENGKFKLNETNLNSILNHKYNKNKPVNLNSFTLTK